MNKQANREVKMKTLATTASVFAIGLMIAGSAEAAALKVAFTIHSSPSNTFWQAVKKGFDDACGRVQADCQMIFTQTEGSIEQQAANMLAALAGKPDALLTSIVDNNAFTSILQDARKNGVTVIGVNVDATQGPSKEARQAFVGQDLFAAGYALGNAQIASLPKEGPLHIVVGVSAPGQNWSEQRAGGITKALEEFKAANSARQIKIVRLDTGTDLAIVADRVGAYLNANKDVNAYFDTGFWHAAVARVLRDRGVPPGKVLLGGFDLVPEVVQEMVAGYVQVQVDQQPYMQGFIPVMEAYLNKTVGLAPTDVNTGKALIFPAQAKEIIELVKKGVR
jgi:simple sugar transport system substrate-binding protein